MKTPREVLLGTHQHIEPRLDALRERFISNLTPLQSDNIRAGGAESATPERLGWYGLILLFRWHLGALAAVWMLIAVLRIDGGAAETPRIARQKVASPRMVILTLKENRRQILELGGPPNPLAPPSLQAPLPSRRSHIDMNYAYS